MEYFLILTAILFFTVTLDYKYRLRLYQSRKERIIIPLIFFVIGTLWDSFAVYRGHWQFNSNIGIKIGLLPLEEYLFFLIIPYFIITLYRVLSREIKG